MSAPLPKRLSRKGTIKPETVKYRDWKPQEIALIERLRANGLTYSQIACNVGTSKSAIASLFRNRIDPVADAGGPVGLRWRIRQLLTAGYGPREISSRIDAPLSLVLDEFTAWEGGA